MEEKKRRGVMIPHDIVEEILVKVPVKSQMRFKSVSREWRGTIESKCYVEKHMRYQKSLGGEKPRIIALLSAGPRRNNVALRNLCLSSKGIAQSCPYRFIRSIGPLYDLKVSQPCDGLFCFYNRDRIFSLVNPATNSFRRLPDPTSTVAEAGGHPESSLLGIGRENSMNPRYKLVWFFDCDNEIVNKSTRCKVFALDSNTWRYVDPPHCRVHYDHPLIHLDGVLYCFSYHREKKCPSRIEQGHKLLAFALHTETFQSFSITSDIAPRFCSELSMCVLNHRLCISKSRVDDNDLFLKIWGLDINKRSWEIIYSIDISSFLSNFNSTMIIPMATMNNYVILSNHGFPIWVLYGSKTHVLRARMNAYYFMYYFETLLSPYQ